MHRWLGGTALVFTGVHVVALLADQYVHFGLSAILIPFASKWHPVAVAWGVVAFYLLLAVELTSLARAHLSKRAWRRVHTASFVLFVMATVHGLTAGTDTKIAGSPHRRPRRGYASSSGSPALESPRSCTEPQATMRVPTSARAGSSRDAGQSVGDAVRSRRW